MELRQLRSLVVLVESDFSVTLTAERLHLVQSAVSQHLSRLEQELGTELFQRQGKRLQGLTGSGEQVLRYARRMLSDTANILAVGRDQQALASGELRIGTTHTQARYVLPAVIREFRASYPQVNLQIHQGTPQQLVEMADSGQVDFSICTEALGDHPNLTALHCYRWNRSLIAPNAHPILERRPLALDTLCEYPLITYVFGFTGANHFRTSFARLGLKPRIVLSAADTDVIKAYVREGFGIGIIATMAYSVTSDSDLQIRNLSRLFPWEVTRIAYHKDKYLRRYERRFIELLQSMVADDGLVLSPDPGART
ncbi:MAG: LysR family transcriptional regulator [Gammaproteobacteria bacterium]|nr:LysR family transcriptional regulator [Gammaproteobacteria bacterium]